jgi:signal peptidase II
MATAPSVRWLWLTLAVVAGDRATKYAIERFTDESFRRDLVPNLATLVHSVNPGVAFGILSESASSWVSIMLIGSSAAVVTLLSWVLVTGRAGNSASQAGLALVAGGAAGNMLDRLLHGGVTDFLELHAGSFRWPAFNVADSAITVGALLVIYELLRGSGHAAKERV